MVSKSPISWKSKLQITVALSSMESELMSISAANQEAQWIRKFLDSIGMTQTSATLIREDNQACIQNIYGTKFQPRSKHIRVCYYYVKEAVQDKTLKVEYVKSEENVADLLMKSLSINKFKELRSKLGMNNTQVGMPLSGSVGEIGNVNQP